jgi:hypothetical protein
MKNVLIFILFIISYVYSSDSLIASPDWDTKIYQGDPWSTFGTSDRYDVGNLGASSDAVGILHFNLTSLSGKTIDSARIIFANRYNASLTSFNIYRMTTQTDGDDISWKFKDASAASTWAGSGDFTTDDYAAKIYATVNVSSVTDDGQKFSDTIKGLISDLVTGNNYGILLAAPGVSSIFQWIYSYDATESSNRPILKVYYASGCTSPTINNPSALNDTCHKTGGVKLAFTGGTVDSLHWLQKPDSMRFVGTDSIWWKSNRHYSSFNTIFSVYGCGAGTPSDTDTIVTTWNWDSLRTDSLVTGHSTKYTNNTSVYTGDTVVLMGYWKGQRGLNLPTALTAYDSSDSFIKCIVQTTLDTGKKQIQVCDSVSCSIFSDSLNFKGDHVVSPPVFTGTISPISDSIASQVTVHRPSCSNLSSSYIRFYSGGAWDDSASAIYDSVQFYITQSKDMDSLQWIAVNSAGNDTSNSVEIRALYRNLVLQHPYPQRWYRGKLLELHLTGNYSTQGSGVVYWSTDKVIPTDSLIVADTWGETIVKDTIPSYSTHRWYYTWIRNRYGIISNIDSEYVYIPGVR